jgi:hypothetical protein
MEVPMKRYFMLGAAMLLLSAVGANASSITYIQLDKSMDSFAITKQGDYYAQVHSFGTLVISWGAGMAATTKEVGKGVMLTDFQQGTLMQICYDFQRPFKTGGKWTAYETLNGASVEWLGSGTYTVIGHANVR